MEVLEHALRDNPLVTAFAFVGFIMLVSVYLSRYLTLGRVHGSAIAIVIGLGLAYWGGFKPGGARALPT